MYSTCQGDILFAMILLTISHFRLRANKDLPNGNDILPPTSFDGGFGRGKKWEVWQSKMVARRKF